LSSIYRLVRFPYFSSEPDTPFLLFVASRLFCFFALPPLEGIDSPVLFLLLEADFEATAPWPWPTLEADVDVGARAVIAGAVIAGAGVGVVIVAGEDKREDIVVGEDAKQE
jgi:hypothetical protein